MNNIRFTLLRILCFFFFHASIKPLDINEHKARCTNSTNNTLERTKDTIQCINYDGYNAAQRLPHIYTQRGGRWSRERTKK